MTPQSQNSVLTVNQTDTETGMFCYLRASSSPRCFRPKTARFLCVLIFFLHIQFVIFFTFCVKVPR